jgi:hypothetical protein
MCDYWLCGNRAEVFTLDDKLLNFTPIPGQVIDCNDPQSFRKYCGEHALISEGYAHFIYNQVDEDFPVWSTHALR